jgi:hypothetical protein
MAGKGAHKARSDKKRIEDVSLTGKWLRHSTIWTTSSAGWLIWDDLGRSGLRRVTGGVRG